jgi:pimeloyl-ACP methyl ester carboxylesterase
MALRHGYTLDGLTRMAHFAARHRKPWHYGVELSVRYEVAWAAIAEHLYAAEQPPTSADLVRAAWEAIRQHADSRRQFLGLAHDGPDGPGRNFERYWRAVAGPADGPEERLIERLALTQIWPHGDRDIATMWGRTAIRELGAHAPKARPSVVLDNCGHWIQQEHPEKVNSLLLEFLSGI